MLSEVLKKTRQKCFLTQTEFAEAIGVSYSTINRWETGKSKPNLAAMKSIKDFCSKNDVSYESIEEEWLGYSKEE